MRRLFFLDFRFTMGSYSLSESLVVVVGGVDSSLLRFFLELVEEVPDVPGVDFKELLEADFFGGTRLLVEGRDSSSEETTKTWNKSKGKN